MASLLRAPGLLHHLSSLLLLHVLLLGAVQGLNQPQHTPGLDSLELLKSQEAEDPVPADVPAAGSPRAEAAQYAGSNVAAHTTAGNTDTNRDELHNLAKHHSLNKEEENKMTLDEFYDDSFKNNDRIHITSVDDSNAIVIPIRSRRSRMMSREEKADQLAADVPDTESPTASAAAAESEVESLQLPEESVQYVQAVKIPEHMRQVFANRHKNRDQQHSESLNNFDRPGSGGPVGDSRAPYRDSREFSNFDSFSNQPNLDTFQEMVQSIYSKNMHDVFGNYDANEDDSRTYRPNDFETRPNPFRPFSRYPTPVNELDLIQTHHDYDYYNSKLYDGAADYDYTASGSYEDDPTEDYPSNDPFGPRNKYNTRPDAFTSSVEITTFRPTVRYPVASTTPTPAHLSYKPYGRPASQPPATRRNYRNRRPGKSREKTTKMSPKRPVTTSETSHHQFGILNHNLVNTEEILNDERTYHETDNTRTEGNREAFFTESRLSRRPSIQQLHPITFVTPAPLPAGNKETFNRPATHKNFQDMQQEKFLPPTPRGFVGTTSTFEPQKLNVGDEKVQVLDESRVHPTHRYQAPLNKNPNSVPRRPLPRRRADRTRGPPAQQSPPPPVQSTTQPRRPKSVEFVEVNSAGVVDKEPIFQDPRSHPEEIRYYDALEDEIRRSNFLTESVRLVSSNSFRELIEESLSKKKTNKPLKVNSANKEKQYEPEVNNPYHSVESNEIATRTNSRRPTPPITFKTTAIPFVPAAYDSTPNYRDNANTDQPTQIDGLIDTMYNFKDYESPMVKSSSREASRFRDIHHFLSSKEYSPQMQIPQVLSTLKPMNRNTFSSSSDRLADDKRIPMRNRNPTTVAHGGDRSTHTEQSKREESLNKIPLFDELYFFEHSPQGSGTAPKKGTDRTAVGERPNLYDHYPPGIESSANSVEPPPTMSNKMNAHDRHPLMRENRNSKVRPVISDSEGRWEGTNRRDSHSSQSPASHEEPGNLSPFPGLIKTRFTGHRRPHQITTYHPKEPHTDEYPRKPGTHEKYPGKISGPDMNLGKSRAPDMMPSRPQAPQMYPGKKRNHEIHPGTSRSPEMHQSKSRAPEMHPGKSRAPEMHPGTSRSPERHPGESRAPEIHPGKSRAPEMHPGKSRTSEILRGKQHASQMRPHESLAPFGDTDIHGRPKMTDYSSIFTNNMGGFQWPAESIRRHDHHMNEDIIYGKRPSMSVGVGGSYGITKAPSHSIEPFVFTSMPYFGFSSRSGVASESVTSEPIPSAPDSNTRSAAPSPREARQRVIPDSYIVPTITHKELAATPSLFAAFSTDRGSRSLKERSSSGSQEALKSKVSSYPPDRRGGKSLVALEREAVRQETAFPKHGYNIDEFFEGFPAFGFFEKNT